MSVLFGWVSWDAVSALATMVATAVALWASVSAIKGPRKDRGEERSEATQEVLSATIKALTLYAECRSVGSSSDGYGTYAARASHLLMTIDRLLNRPVLTDGAILAGSGAMQLMSGIIAQREEWKPTATSHLGRWVTDHLTPLTITADETKVKAIDVAAYADRRQWHQADRFVALRERLENLDDFSEA